MFHNDWPLLVVMPLVIFSPWVWAGLIDPLLKVEVVGWISGCLCNLVCDLAQMTRPFYSLNSDSVYVMNCILCIVRFTTKFVLLVYFADSEEKLGCWPLPCAPHLCWPCLITSNVGHIPWPWVNWNHCSYFTTPLSDHQVSRSLKIQLTGAIRKWMM